MGKPWKADVTAGKTCFSNQFGWYLSYNCVITEKYVYFDNDPYEARMTYIRNLYNLTPQKSGGSVCRQSDSLTVFDPIVRQKWRWNFTKVCWRKRDDGDGEFAHHFVFLWWWDPMNYYTNVLTALKLISVTVATILKLRDFRRIIEHFPLRGHIQGRRIQNCLKG